VSDEVCVSCGKPATTTMVDLGGKHNPFCTPCHDARTLPGGWPFEDSIPFGSASYTDDIMMRARAQVRQNQENGELEPEVAAISLADVKPERVSWLWHGRIPFGKITVFDGDPGLGKSTITLDITGRVTTGSPMPDDYQPTTPMRVVLLSAEDGVADTLVPRLLAVGANRELVTLIDHVNDEQGPRPVDLPGDLDRIERYLATLQPQPGLLVVDPLMAFLGGEVNSNRDQDVRRALFRLKLLAERTGAAVVVVRHLNKMPGGSPLYRGGGSIGIIGAARSGLLAGIDPEDEDRCVLAVSKANLAAKPSSLAYRKVEVTTGDYQTVKVVWEGTSEHSAADLLGRSLERAAPRQDEAETFLRGTWIRASSSGWRARRPGTGSPPRRGWRYARRPRRRRRTRAARRTPRSRSWGPSPPGHAPPGATSPRRCRRCAAAC
jgi:RecA-family ATPase